MRISDWSSDVCSSDLVGGAMVPLDECHTVLDWMAALALPALLVSGTYLGAISHTLTALAALDARGISRSEEHTSELQSLMRISYAVFCLKKKQHTTHRKPTRHQPPN